MANGLKLKNKMSFYAFLYEIEWNLIFIPMDWFNVIAWWEIDKMLFG